MKNIRIQRSLKLIFIAGIFFTLMSCTDNRPDKPNFIFILVDDMGWKDVGCYGSEFYETPNIDRLAKEGMRFTNAYASSSVCSPTRASILTGKNPVNHGITEWIPGRQSYRPKEDHRKFMALPFTQQMEIKEYTIAEALQDNGYETFFAGKWHLGGEDYFPPLQGFKHNVGGCSAGGPYGNKEYFYPFGAPVNGKEGDFLTDNLTNQTLAFIKQNKDKPFLAYLSFYTLHNPLMAPDSLVEKYQEKADQLGYTSEERFTRNREWIDALPENNYKVRLVQDNPVYAAMVEIMDNNVGKIMRTLKELDMDKNTVIFFTGDNGGLATSEGSNTCNLPLRAGKGWLYEGGIREPTIINWPQVINPGSVSDALVISTDFYPTMLEMAGLDLIPSQHTEGKSLVPVLKGKTQEERTLFWHYPHNSNQGSGPASAVRKGKYKLVDMFEKEAPELYDLEKDIGEKNNIANEKPLIKQTLYQELQEWRKANDARMMKPNPDYEPL